jgi:signal transduction histidine kinase
MSFGRKVFLLIFAYYLTAVFNLYLTGFTGAGIPFIIASSILAIFFLDSRSSFFVIIFQFVTLLFIGLMYSFNVFELRLDIVSSNSNMISWILAISIITFQTLIYWNTFSVINKSFHSNLQISSNQQKELEIYNEKLKTLLDKQNKIQQELKLAKNKAEGSSRFKTMFLRNISYEIRTPLNAIIGLSNLIINKEIDEENRKKLCSVILDNGFKLEQIIDNIIEIAEFESDSAEISKSEIELKSFFNELFNVFRIKIDLSKVRFDYKSIVNIHTYISIKINFSEFLSI